MTFLGFSVKRREETEKPASGGKRAQTCSNMARKFEVVHGPKTPDRSHVRAPSVDIRIIIHDK